MYWYYKVPFLIILGLCLYGCGSLVWNRLPEDLRTSLHPTSWVAKDGAEETEPTDEGRQTEERERAQTRPDATTGEAVSSPSPLIRRRLEAAKRQLEAGSWLGARRLAEQVVADESVRPFSTVWLEATDALSTINTRIFNSEIPVPQKRTYVIQPGDSLAKIARRLNTTIGALQRGNDLPPNRATIYPGDTLSIYKARWNIEVIKSRYCLILWDDDRFFKRYEIGVGRQNRTPVGTFVIDNKQKEPVWTPPGRVIEYGSEENVLGTRWLGLKPTGSTNPDLRGYGIHGTWEPETIGTASSEGCVRMRNREVEELFDIVPVGTRVLIRDD